MPYLRLPENKTAEVIVAGMDPEFTVSTDAVIFHAEKRGYNTKSILGYGKRSVVFKTEDPDVAVAYNYEDLDPNYAKANYYGLKVLSTLFPYNFPAMHAAFGAADNNAIEKYKEKHESEDIKPRYTGSIRERIEPTRTILGLIPLVKVRYSLKNVLDISKRIGLCFNYDLINDENFIVSKTGGEYYVDGEIWVFAAKCNINKIINYMKEHMELGNERRTKSIRHVKGNEHIFTQRDIYTVLNALDRLEYIQTLCD